MLASRVSAVSRLSGVHRRALPLSLSPYLRSLPATTNAVHAQWLRAKVTVIDQEGISPKAPKSYKKPYKQASKVAEFVMTNKPVVDTEDMLMAHTDPFSLISSKYHPAIMRAFKESKLMKTENRLFRNAVRYTEKALLALNKKIGHSQLETMQVSFLPRSVEKARVKAEEEFSETCRSLRSVDEWKSMVSFMTVLLPRSTSLWEDFDVQVTKKIQAQPLQYAELALLATYSLHRAKLAYSFWSRDKSNPSRRGSTQHNHPGAALKTPQMIIQYLVDLKKKQQLLQQQQSQSSSSSSSSRATPVDLPLNSLARDIPITVDQNVFEVLAEESASVFTLASPEVFAPLGTLQACENKAMELLGLQLYLLAHNDHLLSTYHPAMKRAILEDLSNHCLKVLSSAHTPVKLSTLREIWESAPKIDLPNAYSIYRHLYQQVLFSITTEPMQIVHQENSICTLCESMISSKFKNSQCLGKLFELVSLQGIDYQKVGVRLFNALVQLDAIPFATMVLESMMKNSNVKLENFFLQSSKGRPFLLTNEAKNQVLRALEQSCTQNYINGAAASSNEENSVINQASIARKKTSDLVLALFCFNREEKKTPFYKLLEQMEVSFLSQTQSCQVSLHDTLGLVHAYAMAGRLQPQLMQALDEVVRANLSQLSSKQMSTVIWSCARLNYRPDYLQSVITSYFAQMAHVTALSTPGVYALSRTLWAAAVLQMLDVDQFLSVQRVLFAAAPALQHVEMHSWMIKQLTQIDVELQFKYADDAEAQNKLQVLRDFLSSSTTIKNLNRRILRENLSSWTHLDASSALSEMGIAHENEKVLPNGYVVDIFIPSASVNSSSKGIVIEFDGPTHFESYLNQPLGPTLMKKRHIEASGYAVGSIPFWRYKHDLGTSQKVKVLREVIASCQK